MGLGLKKVVKGAPNTREKVVNTKKEPAKESGGKKKTVRPMFEGYEGTDLFKRRCLF